MLSKRSNEEVILLLLCSLSIPSILPFGVFRLLEHNWVSATVDLTIVSGMLCIMIFVWRTRRIRLAGIAITVFYTLGMLASVYLKGQSIVYWAYPTMIASFFIIRPKEALAINAVSLLCLVGILHSNTSLLDSSTIVVTLALVNLFSYIFSDRTSLQHFELNQQAKNDFLTGVGNRRAFDRHLQMLCTKEQVQADACLLIFDLDHFKKVNDQFGHAAGDQVLVQFCSLLRSRMRASDHLFRYGGEEFVATTRGTDSIVAARLAEELRQLVEQAELLPNHPVTVSIGVAKRRINESADAWFQRADSMLYAAKLSGRNAVRVAPEEEF